MNTQYKKIYITMPTIATFLVILLATPLFAAPPQKNDIVIGNFSQSDLNGWEEKEFAGKTKYQLVKQGKVTVLNAKATAAASGLFKEVEIDLTTHPYLNWEWKIETKHQNLKERSKAGDDYAARVYVVVSGGVFFWKTRAINYVWSSSEAKGNIWPNAFAGKNAMLVAVRTNQDDSGTWYREKRNIFEDLKNIFGEEIDKIDAIAIMTDSDNSKGEVQASYGDISFSSD